MTNKTRQHALIFPPRSRAREDHSRQNHTQVAINVHCRHPVTPQRPQNGLVCCCVQHTAYSARVTLPCIVNGDDSAFFVLYLVTFNLTLTFELWRYFCTVHLTAKFYDPTFNRSEVIMLTNRQTDKQMPLKTSTSLHYAMPVGNDLMKLTKTISQFVVCCHESCHTVTTKSSHSRSQRPLCYLLIVSNTGLLLRQLCLCHATLAL